METSWKLTLYTGDVSVLHNSGLLQSRRHFAMCGELLCCHKIGSGEKYYWHQVGKARGVAEGAPLH